MKFRDIPTGPMKWRWRWFCKLNRLATPAAAPHGHALPGQNGLTPYAGAGVTGLQETNCKVCFLPIRLHWQSSRRNPWNDVGFSLQAVPQGEYDRHEASRRVQSEVEPGAEAVQVRLGPGRLQFLPGGRTFHPWFRSNKSPHSFTASSQSGS
jgi:hypothetical protein